MLPSGEKHEDIKTGEKFRDWAMHQRPDPNTQMGVKELKRKFGHREELEQRKMEENKEKRRKFEDLLAKFQEDPRKQTTEKRNNKKVDDSSWIGRGRDQKYYETENDVNKKVTEKSASNSKKKKTVIEIDKSKPSDPLTSTCGGGEGGRLDLEGLILGWLCKKRRNWDTEWGIWGTLWVVVVWGK